MTRSPGDRGAEEGDGAGPPARLGPLLTAAAPLGALGWARHRAPTEETQGRTGAEKSKFRFERPPRRSLNLQRRRSRRLRLYGQESDSAPTSATTATPSGSTCHESLHAKGAGEELRLNPASRLASFGLSLDHVLQICLPPEGCRHL